jgi:redox-sensitive bicupin YhaK (pirin superfamily)
MQHWDLSALAVDPHKPVVLQSDDEGRAIALQLPAGEQLQEHEVHERAWMLVVTGEIELDTGRDTLSCGPGFLAVFDPKERREVRALTDTRLLLMLAPWPGEGR